ncbi:MAG: hypothetical protein LIV22_02935 [Olegusella sp.]|nr:hypothetical protein [Olegusella sp.]
MSGKQAVIGSAKAVWHVLTRVKFAAQAVGHANEETYFPEKKRRGVSL